MTRPYGGRFGYVAALAVGASLFAAACAGAAQTRQSTESVQQVRPAKSAPVVVLTSRQARHALLTEAYLGSQWTEVKDSGDWRDGLLRGTVNAHDWLSHPEDAAVCQRLLDRLSGEQILSTPLAGTQAVAVFDADDGNRMRYTVATYTNGELRAARRWLDTLPLACGAFTATRSDGSTEAVRITSLLLPDEHSHRDGTRQALSVVAKGTTEGVPFTVSLDVALVTSGDSALTVVNGGVTDASHVITEFAVRLGALRLATVLAGGTPPDQPEGLLD
jgi:hypothetical protein